MLTSGRLLLQMTLNALDSGLKDAVSDLMTKTLQKMAALPELSSDDIDDTVLMAGGEQSPSGETNTADEYTFPLDPVWP